MSAAAKSARLSPHGRSSSIRRRRSSSTARIMRSSTSVRTRSGLSSTTSSAARRCPASTKSRCAVLARAGADRGDRSRNFGRTVEALRRFRAIADAMGVSRIDATATEAIRRATNGPELVALINAETGLDIRVLSGAEGGALRRARRHLRLLPARRPRRRHGRRQPGGGRGARRPCRRPLGEPAARRPCRSRR